MNSANIPTPAGQKIELPNTAYILPDNIAMWPPVWWSWLVIAFIVVSLIVIVIVLYMRYKRNAYRRDASQLLDSLSEYQDHELLSQCHQTIRRCLVTIGRHDLASMPSQALFNQLDLQLASKHQFKQLGTLFIHGAYQPQLSLDKSQKEQILQVTKYWCRRHNIHA
jgi:hypothetical protein